VASQWVDKWETTKYLNPIQWMACKCKTCNNSQEWWWTTKWWACQPKVCTLTQICKWCSTRMVPRTHKTLNSSTVWCQTNSCKCRKWWACRCNNRWVVSQLSSTLKTSKRPKMDLLNKWTDKWQSVQWSNHLMCSTELRKHVLSLMVARMSKLLVN